MSDYFEDFVDKLEVKCPVHNTNMKGKRIEIRTGYTNYLRKIMYIGKCLEKECDKWFEWDGCIIWP
jgi:hypothetical protein